MRCNSADSRTSLPLLSLAHRVSSPQAGHAALFLRALALAVPLASSVLFWTFARLLPPASGSLLELSNQGGLKHVPPASPALTFTPQHSRCATAGISNVQWLRVTSGFHTGPYRAAYFHDDKGPVAQHETRHCWDGSLRQRGPSSQPGVLEL